MRMTLATLAVLLFIVLSPMTVFGQSAPPSPTASVPRLIYLSGVFKPADSQPAAAVEAVTLVIYAEAEGGTPLWQETQSVAVDDKGRYALLLGASTADGIPAAVWTAGAQWLGTRFERAGEVEGPRARLTSVPYALRAADAETLGGRPASEYLLAPTSSDGHTAESAGIPTADSGSQPSASTPQDVQPGTVNFLSKYVTPADVGDSAVFENAGRVGIGTVSPLDALHVRYTNPNGTMTGLAVQNLGNTAASYSGMLFYDQNGATALFQGFNNVTHEYRINNVASGGSINFLIGSSSKFAVASNGDVTVNGAVHGSTPVSGVAGLYGGNTAGTGGTATGVRGETASTSSGTGANGGVTGVLGLVVPTSPGGYSAGVRGVNNGTSGNGIGVVGYQGGSGWGVYGETPSGFGVYGVTTSVSGASTGVRGETYSTGGTGVVARYSGTGVGNALNVGNGTIKVSGTNKAAFQHTATAGNINANYTTIDNPMTNGDPNAMLLVTPVLLPPDNVYANFPIGVWYSTGSSKWTIFNQISGGGFPVNAAFNVLVIKQ
jgi:hypothetical protein